MITPLTPAQQAVEDFREEIRQQFEQLHAEISQIREGLRHASQPAPAVAGGTYKEMMIDTIIMTYDDAGKAAYKATGAPYNKFGVRVWPEILPVLGIDPTSLKPGPNPMAQPIAARVEIITNTEGKDTPRKVTGRA